MNLKLLFIINDEEKRLSRIVNKYSLPFNTLLYGEGTASKGILDFLGLTKTDKNILLSIIPDNLEKDSFSNSLIPSKSRMCETSSFSSRE